MTQERLIRFDGTVAEILAGGKFRVRFTNGHEVVADGLSPDSDAPGVGDAITLEMPSHGAPSSRLFFRRLSR
ncbi:MAG: hypothetical protein AB7E79_16525 [Rhodospirillaceae bacterium]